MFILSFFFFKQKTAYEMRISDWSSDVCSSDLVFPPAAPRQSRAAYVEGLSGYHGQGAAVRNSDPGARRQPVGERRRHGEVHDRAPQRRRGADEARDSEDDARFQGARRRSEEHTSELQSIMRLSYAVFYLKKKIQHHKYNALQPRLNH